MNNNKILHYGLIVTFSILYLATAFVSFYHAIEFFNLSNERWLSVILSLVAEIGQATVLFSLLMSTNKNKIMPWIIMFILTALQVIGNVYSCYVFIEEANSTRFIFFQKSILFFIEESPETMKVIVAWITGSLLPIIALCLTSLVAENLNLSDKDYVLTDNNDTETEDTTQNVISNDDTTQNINIGEDVSERPILTNTVVSNTPIPINTPIEPTEIKVKKKRVKKIENDKLVSDTTVPNNKNIEPSTNNIETIEVK